MQTYRSALCFIRYIRTCMHTFMYLYKVTVFMCKYMVLISDVICIHACIMLYTQYACIHKCIMLYIYIPYACIHKCIMLYIPYTCIHACFYTTCAYNIHAYILQNTYMLPCYTFCRIHTCFHAIHSVEYIHASMLYTQHTYMMYYVQ